MHSQVCLSVVRHSQVKSSEVWCCQVKFGQAKLSVVKRSIARLCEVQQRSVKQSGAKQGKAKSSLAKRSVVLYSKVEQSRKMIDFGKARVLIQSIRESLKRLSEGERDLSGQSTALRELYEKSGLDRREFSQKVGVLEDELTLYIDLSRGLTDSPSDLLKALKRMDLLKFPTVPLPPQAPNGSILDQLRTRILQEPAAEKLVKEGTYTESQISSLLSIGSSVRLPRDSDAKYPLFRELVKGLDIEEAYVLDGTRPFETTYDLSKTLSTEAIILRDEFGIPTTVVDKKDAQIWRDFNFPVIEAWNEEFLLTFQSKKRVLFVGNQSGDLASWELYSPRWLNYLFERSPKLVFTNVLADIWGNGIRPEHILHGIALFGELLLSTEAYPQLKLLQPYKATIRPFKTSLKPSMYLGRIEK